MTTRRQKVHGVEMAAGGVTGAFGSAFGAAKLRDSYKESYPERFTRRVDRIPSVLRAAGVSQQGGARAARIVSRGKPGFVPLATAVAAGSVATGARRYGAHLDRKHRLSKSDTGHGYRPAIDMTAKEHRAAGLERASVRQARRTGAGTPPSRGLADVYAADGVRPGIHAAVNSPTRPSSVHPSVHYGSSVSPEFERRLDRHLSPSATAKLRHPVVFHRGATAYGAIAAAARPHITTGQRGHVIFNQDRTSASGHVEHGLPATVRAITHHELAHAAVRGGNPARTKTARTNIGEEARADAAGVPGRGLYRSNRMVPSRAKAKGMAAIGRHFESHDTSVPELGHAEHYHHVHAKVRSALGQPPGLAREVAYSVARRGMRPKPLVATGAVAAAAVHHNRETRVSKSAFGVALTVESVAKARFSDSGPSRAPVVSGGHLRPIATSVKSRGWLTGADRRDAAGKAGQRLATGVRVAKSDRRMSAEPPGPWTGHLPRHTAGAVAANKSEFLTRIETPGRIRPVKPGLRVMRPLITRVVAKSAFGPGHRSEARTGLFDPEGHRHRRAGFGAGVLAAGAGGAGAGSVGSARTARAHAAAARQHDVAAASSFASADAGMNDVRTRLSGHARRSAGGKTAASGLPNTAASFRQTMEATERVRRDTGAGHAARRAQHARLGAAKLATRRSGALGVTALGLGAAAGAVHGHGKRGGRTYGYR